MKESGNPAVMPVLLQLVKENAGVAVNEQDENASFFELGLDSLFLTQFSISLANRFGVKLTFRQLSSELDNLNKLAAFLDNATGGPAVTPTDHEPDAGPGGRPASSAARPAVVPQPAVLSGASDPLIQLFLGQIEVMQQQLAALGASIAQQPASHPAVAVMPTTGMPAAAAVAPRATAASATLPSSAADPHTVAAIGGAFPASAAGFLDASRPPVPGARLGRDRAGRPAWFVPKADQPGKYVELV